MKRDSFEKYFSSFRDIVWKIVDEEKSAKIKTGYAFYVRTASFSAFDTIDQLPLAATRKLLCKDSS